MSTIPQPKLRARVFKEAACQVAENCGDVGACWGIYKALNNEIFTTEHRFFNGVLRPSDAHNAWWYNGGPECTDVKTARVLGLLLCAELVEDGWTL